MEKIEHAMRVSKNRQNMTTDDSRVLQLTGVLYNCFFSSFQKNAIASVRRSFL